MNLREILLGDEVRRDELIRDEGFTLGQTIGLIVVFLIFIITVFTGKWITGTTLSTFLASLIVRFNL